MEKEQPEKVSWAYINLSLKRIDDLAELREKYILERFKDFDIKYQIQFTAAEKAIAIASTAQEKLVAQALDGTKEAINKADVATDKRFELLGEKITDVTNILNKNAGAQGIYVTHTDLGNAFDKFRIDIESVLKPIVSKLADVTVYMNSQQGRSEGLSLGWKVLIGILGLVVVILSIINGFSALAK